MSTSTPRYPSAAELAAFRRSINPAWFAAYEHGYRDMNGATVAANGTMKRFGCPVRNGRDHVPAIARREASALRSRAYRAIADSAWGYDPDWQDFARYRETFCPENAARTMRLLRTVYRAFGAILPR